LLIFSFISLIQFFSFLFFSNILKFFSSSFFLFPLCSYSTPGDLSRSSTTAYPNNWGPPYAKFLLGNNCPLTHFQNQQMIFDLTFCGDWAGSVFSSDCPGLGNCNDYVQNNPTMFEQAYWSIDFVKVMQY
jgi:hypothetical protein